MTDVDEATLTARLMLSWLFEPGSKAVHFLVAKHGPQEALNRVLRGHVPEDLHGPAASRLQGEDPAAVAERLFADAYRLGVRIVVPESQDWPSTLDDLSRISVDTKKDRIERDTFPPHALWVRGTLPLMDLPSRAVSIVGARAASGYGLHMAADIAYGLSSRGWTVISGGAYGIDAAAHRGALAGTEFGGSTVAVLACGVDRPYPVAHQGLFEQIVQSGLLISEWPPGAHPYRNRFLIRNRVIAALSRGTVLVEASARSGARFTLRRARELGRPTMVVPGPATSANFIGNHEILRTEVTARLVTNAAQVIEDAGPMGEFAELARGPIRPFDHLSSVDQQLVDAAPRRDGALASQIAAEAGIGLREALAILPSLAVRGYLHRTADGRYCLLT